MSAPAGVAGADLNTCFQNGQIPVTGGFVSFFFSVSPSVGHGRGSLPFPDWRGCPAVVTMTMKIAIRNLHNLCEHNTLFLSRARRYFELNRHQVIDDSDQEDGVDLVFIGGCAVTDAMRGRCEEAIRELAVCREPARVVVFGCLAAFPENFLPGNAAENRISLIPFRESRTLDNLIGARIPYDAVNVNHLVGHVPYQPRMGSDDAYVLIAQGCVNDCSYCTIKKAKGEVSSRSEEAIVSEILDLHDRGVRTVTLLADDCGSYGLDAATDLPLLLDRLNRTVPEMRYKIYTMFPGIFLKQAKRLEPFVAGRRIVYLCLPAQSAAPRILDLMNRRYDPGELADVIGRFKSLDPGLFIGSHFIYNFPTESPEEFERSLGFARHFDHCVFIGYGENSGTRAAAFFPKCDARALEAKTRRLEERVREGRLAAFVVPRT
jgi:ribosomal protein S12 methylthiotransferase